jgi:hypothetical protein
VDVVMAHPLKALAIAWRGVKTKGPMAPEIAMENQRPAQYIFDGRVQQKLSKIRANEAREKAAQTSASAAIAAFDLVWTDVCA